MNKTVLIYDLDDTLIDTSNVYYFARKNYLEILEKQGINADVALNEFESVDSININLYGYIPDRYKISMIESYKNLCNRLNLIESTETLKDLEGCGNIIIEKMPELIQDAKKLLEWGKKNKYRQILFTRGIESLQRKKIEYAGLSSLFDFIKIVETKNTEVLRNLLAELKVQKTTCWIIGDSIKSDINPAIELGINSILYLYEHESYFWEQEYGHEAKGEFYCVKEIMDVKDIIERPEKFKKISVLF